jgi:hypothetical protein
VYALNSHCGLEGPYRVAPDSNDQKSSGYSWTVDICVHVPMTLFDATDTRCFHVEANVLVKLQHHEPNWIMAEVLFGMCVLTWNDVLSAGSGTARKVQCN